MLCVADGPLSFHLSPIRANLATASRASKKYRIDCSFRQRQSWDRPARASITACAASMSSPSSRQRNGAAKDITKVLLYAPQVVGYARIALLGAALLSGAAQPHLTVSLFVANFFLDGLDGYLARTLQQTSAFGAFLDVAIDCCSRGVLYVWALDGPLAALPIVTELLTFVATHKGGGAAWKSGCFSQAPWYVSAVMADGFKTPAGVLAVAGLMGLPLWLWVRRFLPGSWFAALWCGAALLAGRLLAASVEVWVLVKHMQALLQEDAAALALKQL